MANIASTFVRMDLRDPADVLLEREVLEEILGPPGTYHVPVWSRQDGGTLDLQFGVRWGGEGVADRIWNTFRGRVTSVWVRWYNDGGEFDDIEHRPMAPWPLRSNVYCYRGGTWIRRCRYAYDGIRVTWRTVPGAAAATLGGWRWHRDGAAHIAAAAGDYLAGNDWCDLLDDPTLATPTTPTRGIGPYEGDFEYEPFRWWRAAQLPAALSDSDLSLILCAATRLELTWHGRAVMVMARDDAGAWRFFSLDDWDNCADPAYLFERLPAEPDGSASADENLPPS
ncbi:hypothetical protein [Nocardia veterana]|uniref:Uncharacterized protein n=1 Tax=Nocardia veterana TaxID=132249 RepID=A0A7X6LZ46_9NOCA|nr:hypothetical protein [Nocardia veterana]NKY87206.1 hypothetical protein [Nocardia veterana]